MRSAKSSSRARRRRLGRPMTHDLRRPKERHAIDGRASVIIVIPHGDVAAREPPGVLAQELFTPVAVGHLQRGPIVEGSFFCLRFRNLRPPHCVQPHRPSVTSGGPTASGPGMELHRRAVRKATPSLGPRPTRLAVGPLTGDRANIPDSLSGTTPQGLGTSIPTSGGTGMAAGAMTRRLGSRRMAAGSHV
jgi:hypothetical protein